MNDNVMFLVQTLDSQGEVVSHSELEITGGDLLLLHAPEGMSTEELYHLHNAFCNSLGSTPCVLTVPNGATLQVVRQKLAE